MTRLDDNPSEPASKEWRDYRREPGPGTFAALLSATIDADGMRSIQIAMQRLYWESDNWRVAQHLAMLLSGSDAHFPEWPRDQLLAAYFASYARANSQDAVAAHIVEARIFWERRLCPAALHSLSTIADAPNFGQLGERVLSEYWTLFSLCNAYLGWTEKAWNAMRMHVTNQRETLFQLMWSLEAGDPILDQISSMLGPNMNDLIPHHQALFKKHWRLRLLFLMRCHRDR